LFPEGPYLDLPLAAGRIEEDDLEELGEGRLPRIEPARRNEGALRRDDDVLLRQDDRPVGLEVRVDADARPAQLGDGRERGDRRGEGRGRKKAISEDGGG